MKPFRIALLSLWLASALYAIDIKLPAEVKGEPGSFVSVKADTTGKVVKWSALDKGISLLPDALLKDSKTAVVTSATPGKYRLICWTSDDKGPSDLAYTTVTIGVPEPPPPPDTLIEDLKAAYAADTGENKAKQVADLASLYSLAGGILDKVKTLGELQATLLAARRNLMADDALVGVRRVVNKELATLGTTPTAAVDKEAAKKVFSKLSAALKGVKP